MANPQNIASHTIRSATEAREKGRRGGIKSGETRKRRKTMAESLISILSKPIRKGRTKEDVDSLEDFKTANVDVQTRILASLIAKAASGNVKAAVFIRDTIGEKPVEKFEDKTPPRSPFILGTIAVEKVEAAKKRHDERQLHNGDRP